MLNYLKLSEKLRETYLRETKKFEKALGNPSEMQKNKLLGIIRKNESTIFGKNYNFEEINSTDSFIEKIPISTYEDYLDYIEKIKDGENNVLTTEQVILLEPTSGSISASKYIPYTTSLFEDFQAGIFPWLYDVMSTYPKMMEGSLYWSITPATHKNKKTTGGIKIGFGDDASYFKDGQGYLLSKLSSVPFSVVGLSDMKEFKKQTLVSLLSDRDLTFVSIWNPTFFSNLLKEFEDSPEDILSSIKDTKRVKLLRKTLKNRKVDVLYEEIWPNISLISSWTEGNSNNFLRQLKKRFPNTPVQGKGLISTEAFISLPYSKAGGNILSINSHFFEFKELESKRVVLLGGVKKGGKYEVIVTTSGGLYRYNTQDIIEVTGFYKKCPLLKFIGRNNNVSDLFGEKLNEFHVNKILQKEFAKRKINPPFFMMAPEKDKSGEIFYTLFIKEDSNKLKSQEIDKKLRGNFHYNYCRELGQLKELRIFEITSENPEKIYFIENQRRGIRLGDIKQKILDSEFNWSSSFEGRFIN
jgi:hypothetical protein